MRLNGRTRGKGFDSFADRVARSAHESRISSTRGYKVTMGFADDVTSDVEKNSSIHIVDAPEERKLVPNTENGHEWNALIVHSSYQIVHHLLQKLYHHHHYPIRLRIKPSSSLVMPDKSWSPALTLRLSGIPWRVPRSLRSLVHDPIANTNILMRYRILVALPKSTTRRARDSVSWETGRWLSTGG